MEVKNFNINYTLRHFYLNELPELLGIEFPYLEFVSRENPLAIQIYKNNVSFLSGITLCGHDIQHGERHWEPANNKTALEIICEIIRREPMLAFYHLRHHMDQKLDAQFEKIMGAITALTYAPGGPGYEEAKRDFEERLGET